MPKKIKIKNGIFELKSGSYVYLSTKNLFKSVKKLKNYLKRYGVNVLISYYKGSKTSIVAEVNRGRVKEKSGYKLIVTSDGIKIYGNNNQGLHYGLMTLIQIIKNYGTVIPVLEIHDWPEIENRGVLIDVSRDKVPKLETLFQLVDLFSELKYNQLQLYTEHTFAYREHEKVWKGYSPFTSEDIIELDKYCRERFIELVPNQASFGHMEKWLVHDDYSYMAETSEFDTLWGRHFDRPFTLSPAVEDSIKFLASLYNELLPHFRSKLFNVNCDETFDLCMGKSKSLCKKYGKGKVYLEFVMKIYNIVISHGKRMMMWGDVLKEYSELLKNVPKDIVVLIWGYEKDHPFEKECSIFKDFDFYVCPGTSSWNSILGRVENAILNIKNAVKNGLKYKAKGFLLTDWGDNGHWQHLPISFVGFLYGAALSWGFNENSDLNLEEALNKIGFNGEELGGILCNIGNAYKLTGIEVPNSTLFALPLLFPEKVLLTDKMVKMLKLENLNKTKEILEGNFSLLRQSNAENSNDLIKEEIKNSIEIALFSVDLLISLLKTGSNSITGLPKVVKQEFKYRFEKIVDDYKAIWKKRNREGGLNESLKKLTKICSYLE